MFISNSRGFHGLFVAAPYSLTNCGEEERENGWLQFHNFMSY